MSLLRGSVRGGCACEALCAAGGWYAAKWRLGWERLGLSPPAPPATGRTMSLGVLWSGGRLLQLTAVAGDGEGRSAGRFGGNRVRWAGSENDRGIPDEWAERFGSCSPPYDAVHSGRFVDSSIRRFARAATGFAAKAIGRGGGRSSSGAEHKAAQPASVDTARCCGNLLDRRLKTGGARNSSAGREAGCLKTALNLRWYGVQFTNRLFGLFSCLELGTAPSPLATA